MKREKKFISALLPLLIIFGLTIPVSSAGYYANAQSVHFVSGYYVELMVDDPESTIQSVSVTGPGIDGSTSLVSGIHPLYPNQWWSRPNVSLGTSPPSLPLVYTFTIMEKIGSTYVVKDNVLSYVESFATDLSPRNGETVTGELVFSWKGIDLPEVKYKIELYEAAGNRIWDSPTTSNTSYVYDGPTLAPGEYQYYICSYSRYGDSSLARETFRIGGPIASFTVKVNSSEVTPGSPVRSGDVVSFDASDSQGAIVSYEWDFGDGSEIETHPGNDPFAHHRFRGAMNEPKNYEVRLVVRDNQGASDSDTAEIIVKPLEKTLETTYRSSIGMDASVEAKFVYNWVDTRNGEDVYIMYRIDWTHSNFSGISSLYILAEQNQVIWWDSVLSRTEEKSYTPPFSTSMPSLLSRLLFTDRWDPRPCLWKFYGEDFFEGLEVYESYKMHLSTYGTAPGVHFGTDPTLVLLQVLAEWLPIVAVKTDSAYFSVEPAEVEWEPRIDDIKLAHLYSPGELRVYDSQGRVTGLVDGVVKEEIPNSGHFDNVVVISSPFDSYRYEIVGTDDGTYGLTAASIEEGEATTFGRANTAIAPGATHRYTIDWDALSQGGEGVTVQIDSDGDGTFEQTIIIQPPIASFTCSPENPQPAEEITFDASESYDPDGEVVSYEWDFGDGNTSSGKVLTHTYSTVGDYTVTLIVTDDDGALSTYSRVVVVGHVPGDANGDGVVNNLDITKVERIIVGLDAETPGADANQDGVVNNLDITKVERIIVGLD